MVTSLTPAEIVYKRHMVGGRGLTLDSVRGGKVVIQAKRYTNTVGVAAVSDLYGTVMSEGATGAFL